MLNNRTQNMLAMAIVMGGGNAGDVIDAIASTTHGEVTELPWCKAGTEEAKLLYSFGFRYVGEPTAKTFMPQVTSPPGWTIKPTDHWLYKRLCDPAGYARFELMIHHQDRDASVHVLPRYRVGSWSACYYYKAPSNPCIRDSNTNLVWLGTTSDTEETAQEILKSSTANLTEEELWTQDHVFPASPVDFTQLKRYPLWSACYRVGSDSIADSDTTYIQTTSDEEAIKLAEKRTEGSLLGYDWSYALRDPAGKEIWKKDKRQPRRLTRQDGMSYMTPDGPIWSNGWPDEDRRIMKRKR